MVCNGQGICGEQISGNGRCITMDELYAFLKYKLEEMRKEKKDTVEIDYYKVAQMYQVVCFMKQIGEIVDWGDK